MRAVLLAAVFVGSACTARVDNPIVDTGDAGKKDGGGGDGGAGADGGGSDGGGAGDGGGCIESWSCTPWAVQNGQATRTCVDFAGCGTTVNKPKEGPLPLPALDLPFFQCKVQPILDRGCSMLGCHGTTTLRQFQTFARGRLRNDEMVPQVPSCPIGPQTVNLKTDGSGTIMCVGWSKHTTAEWQKNFDSARLYALELASPDDCELLLQPLAGTSRQHDDKKPFASKADADYQTIRDWITGSKLAGCDPGAD